MVLVLTCLWLLLMLLSLSLNLILNSSLVLSLMMMYLCFFLVNPSLSTNASSLENNELEQMSFAKDKPLQMYKKRTPLLVSDLTTMPMSIVPILDTQSGKNLTLSSEHIF